MAHSKRDSGKSSKAWQAYEEATLYVLKEIREHFHLVEIKGKQEVLGQESGTRWKLDVMGVRDGDGAVIIVECRRRRSRLS
jgi:RecB family endonuclease NucS